MRIFGFNNYMRRRAGGTYLRALNDRWSRTSRRKYRKALRHAGCPTSNRFYREFRYT